MVLLANAGLLFAPAAHAGALFPGVTPLMVATLAAAILREPFTSQKRIGCVLIAMGAIGIVWGAGGTIGTTQNIGHLLFLSAGLAWAGYTVAMRRARIDGLHAASLAAVCSLALYLPIYAYFAEANIFKAPLSDIALQAIVQGLLTGVVALLLYGRMISILGATRGAAFLALTPAMTALLGIPILGELPSTFDWMAIVVISIGVYIVSRGPLPSRIMRWPVCQRAEDGRVAVGRVEYPKRQSSTGRRIRERDQHSPDNLLCLRDGSAPTRPSLLHPLETASISEDIDRKRFLPRQIRRAYKLRILDTVSSSEHSDHDPFGS
jgi:drug/metabolite transporter (DMT)-like permease